MLDSAVRTFTITKNTHERGWVLFLFALEDFSNDTGVNFNNYLLNNNS